MSATWEAKVRKKHIKRMEDEWEQRRHLATPSDQEEIIKRQKAATAQWNKRRKETGTDGHDTLLDSF